MRQIIGNASMDKVCSNLAILIIVNLNINFTVEHKRFYEKKIVQYKTKFEIIILG